VINDDMLAGYTTRNQAALIELVEKHGVDLRPFPDDVLQKLQTLSDEVVAEVAEGDPMSGKVYKTYRDKVKAYHAVIEQAYINSRD
jgi:TRAP-type mannitol/chloroaromatic compound transport system substrate-binding protein